MLKEKLRKWTARTFYEPKQEVEAVLRSIAEAELISVIQK
jgi:hypothetical protein